MPKVTVIIPAYNAQKHVEEAINSVLTQTFKDFELIVVNDASTDKTKKVIEKAIAHDKRAQLLDLNLNGGKANGLNKALDIAKGEYVCFLDADDIYFRDKLEQQVNFLEENPEVDMVYGGAKYFGENLEHEETIVLDSSDDFYENLKKSGEKTIEELNAQHHGILSDKPGIISACSPMIKRVVFDRCRFDPELRNIEDYDMWYQIIGAGYTLKAIKKPFYYYRVHADQKSGNPKKRQIAKDRIFNKIISGAYFK